MNHREAGRFRNVCAWVITGTVAAGLPTIAGFVFARLFAPTVHSRYFPWLTGRALGIAGYVSLSTLVFVGVWMRHPWRLRRPLVHSETRLRVHASLATATIALVVGHVVALASDRYAGVGWIGAIVPGESRYRTLAVSLGVIAMLLMTLLFASARAAGRFGARHWLTYHHFAVVTFILVWFHGVLAGTDTAALRWLYVTSGATILALTVSRYMVARRENSTESGTRVRTFISLREGNDLTSDDGRRTVAP